MNKTIGKRVSLFGILVLIGVFLLGIGGCKKIAVPDAIIKVSNECGLAVDVFLNDTFQFSVEYEETKSIEELDDGTYEIEARRKGTGEFVARETLNVIFNRIYTWSVWSSASIIINNKYGETLSIYGDGMYSGDVEDQADVELEHVPYGDRKIEAKTSDDAIVATTIISVLVDIKYEWTIEK